MTKEEVIEFLSGMSVLEIAGLVKDLEEKWGVSAILADVGPNKINVIKEVRAITGLGLKESKDLVEGAPKPIKQGVAKAEAEELKKKLEATGAKIEIK